MKPFRSVWKVLRSPLFVVPVAAASFALSRCGLVGEAMIGAGLVIAGAFTPFARPFAARPLSLPPTPEADALRALDDHISGTALDRKFSALEARAHFLPAADPDALQQKLAALQAEIAMPPAPPGRKI